MAGILDRLAAALSDRYRVERELGQGGMATVYLAEDLKHDRKVALKVLKPELAAVLGAERFVQEIKTTASLQHPNILPLFDSGTAGQRDGGTEFLYYVMPYIEGETLRDKLNRERQLSIDEAVKIASEVADALAVAHHKGVIHRDIKPENILLHNGRPMVADFGIALAVSAAAGGRMTETGLSLGTPHYMSPEQATAEREITARSDVYSLGSVLYEMLTGEPPHTGGSAQAIIMKIVTEPADPVTKIRKSVPPNVAAAVAKALEKLAADRFDSAKAFAEALANPAFTVSTAYGGVVGMPTADWRQRAAVPVAVALVVVGALALWGWLRPEPAVGVHRERILLGDQRVGPVAVLQMALANDASAIAYVQPADEGLSLRTGDVVVGPGPVWIKERDAADARVLDGTDNAFTVSFSPDGNWVLYGTESELRRVPRLGGASMLVSDSARVIGAAWLSDETVVFIGQQSGKIYRVSAHGGEAQLLIDLPEVMPGVTAGIVRPVWGADAVLVWGSSGLGPDQVLVLDLATNEIKPVLTGGTAAGAWSLATGQLVYGQQGGGVFVAPFDVRSLELAGPGVPLLQGVPSLFGFLEITISPFGTALYRQGGVSTNAVSTKVEPVWIREDGSATPIEDIGTLEVHVTGGFSISPNGQMIAYDAVDQGPQDVWIRTLTGSQPPTRLTFEGRNRRPTWSPDAKSVVFISDRDGGHEAVWIRRADGRERARLLLKRDRAIFEALISPDGHWLVYRTNDDGAVGDGDILALQLDGDSVEVEVAVTEAQETSPALSPDGRWLAYAKGPDNSKDIFVVPFPSVAEGGPYQVSTGGGTEPVWSTNGQELFYRSPAGLVMVEIATESGFAQLSQRTLFPWSDLLMANPDHRFYQIGSHDRQFLFFRFAPDVGGEAGSLVLVENWLDEIEKLSKR
jgi:serine/threonine-protein kinase